MKTSRLSALAVLFFAAVACHAAHAQEHPAQTHEHPAHVQEQLVKPGGIVAVAAGTDNLKTFVAAVKAAGLVETLEGQGPFTVFAPTDEAFARLPAGMLDDLLKPANQAQLAGLLACHVVPGKIMSADMKTMKATSVSSRDLALAVGDGVVTVDNAQVVAADVVATNGVIHAIDAVILPTAPVHAPDTARPKDHPAH